MCERLAQNYIRRMLLVPKILTGRRKAGTSLANLWRDAAATAISISLIHPDKEAAGREKQRKALKKSRLSAVCGAKKNAAKFNKATKLKCQPRRLTFRHMQSIYSKSEKRKKVRWSAGPKTLLNSE